MKSLTDWQASCPITKALSGIAIQPVARSMTLTEFADHVGVSTNTARAWQQGSQPRQEHLQRMGRLVGDGISKRLAAWRRERPQV